MVIIYSETWERPVFSKEGRLELLLTVERVIIPDCGTTGLRISQFCISFTDPHTTSWLGVEYNAPVRIGGVTVLPGDIVVGDDGGVFFFPPSLVETVLDYAKLVEDRKNFSYSY